MENIKFREKICFDKILNFTAHFHPFEFRNSKFFFENIYFHIKLMFLSNLKLRIHLGLILGGQLFIASNAPLNPQILTHPFYIEEYYFM